MDNNLSIYLFFFQFPVPANYQKSAENLGLSYVTERILASVLPRRSVKSDSGRTHTDEDDDKSQEATTPTQDIYEKELILMLEQKHGKVSGFFFNLSDK